MASGRGGSRSASDPPHPAQRRRLDRAHRPFARPVAHGHRAPAQVRDARRFSAHRLDERVGSAAATMARPRSGCSRSTRRTRTCIRIDRVSVTEIVGSLLGRARVPRPPARSRRSGEREAKPHGAAPVAIPALGRVGSAGGTDLERASVPSRGPGRAVWTGPRHRLVVLGAGRVLDELALGAWARTTATSQTRSRLGDPDYLTLRERWTAWALRPRDGLGGRRARHGGRSTRDVRQDGLRLVGW